MARCRFREWALPMTWSTPMRCGSCAMLLLLAGCTSMRRASPPPPRGDASWRMVVPKDTVRYQLAMGEVFSGGTPFQRVTPAYPVDQLASCPPPQEVPALLIVDKAGKVAEVRVAGEATADAQRRAFAAAVRAAALQWQFNPLQINRWAADANGNSHVVASATEPFSLAYVFRFECSGGRAEISTRPDGT
jgi:hypothetical protein